MKRSILMTVVAFLCCQAASGQYEYPETKTVDASDTFWGVTVHDPYRWLEDLKDLEVVDWFKAQADYTNAQMAKIPGQDAIIRELESLDVVRETQYRPIGKAGGKYFFIKKESGEAVAKLFFRKGEKGKDVLLFDPQKYEDGKTMEFTAGVSDDGSRVVLNLSEAGSEIGDIRVLDAATGKLLPDIIPHSGWGHFAGGSNSEIFYQQLKSYDFRDPEFMMNAPNKLHIVGTSVSDDITVVSSAKDPELNIPAASLAIVHSFKDSPYMILGIYTVDNNVTRHYAPRSELRSKKINWRPLTAVEDEIRNYFVKGSDIFFVTGKGNPRFKLIKTSLKDPDLKTAVTIVEGDEEWQLSPDNFAQTKDHLLFAKSKNELIAKTFIYEFKTGRISEVSVPLSGNIFPRSLSEHDNEAALINSGWNTPDNIFKYDVKNRILSEGVFHSSARFSGLKDVVFEEVEVMSHDGVAVPLSIVYKKSLLKKDGSNTVYMQGYGAFGEVAYRPFFDQSYLPLLERGVVLAFAHVRGGGEKGSEWHLAGKKETKPNTWKDLNACAEWLIRNKYTAAERFGISGASAGGILIGRAITERPDLYRVAIPKVGVLNSLRAEFAPGGEGLVPEFGSITNKKDFPALYKMDAYQHVQDKVKYPAQLITTGFNDPRVPSWLPAKFAAKMQAKNGSANPVFLDVDFGTGHFGAATAKERYAQIAKEYAFLLWQTGHPEFQP